MELNFLSQKELFIRVQPALNSKKEEFKRLGYIVEDTDIWNYLIKTKWKKGFNLSLSDIVEDILELDYYELEKNN